LRKSRGILWVELGENDKYGRTIATFWRYSTHSPDVYVTENSINTEMIQTNLGYPYDGGNK
jgi:endonuclease YncB( thermonuclease family)